MKCAGYHQSEIRVSVSTCRAMRVLFGVLMALSASVDPSPLNENVTLNLINRQWNVVDDGVMGGYSQGYIDFEGEAVTFSGLLSIKNNGGFSSIYMPVSRIPKHFNAVKITVQGDGNAYQLRLRRELQGYSLPYRAKFDTKVDKKTELIFPLSVFEASFRGRVLSKAPPLIPESVTHLGFLITKKENEAFSLTIHKVELVSI